MGQNVDIGLAVTANNSSTLATTTFDSVSITSSASPAPIISSVSSNTGSVGSQIIISGSGFGSTQGNGAVFVNDTPMTVSSWSGASITMTVASGATSGPLVVSVAPAGNDSNSVDFEVTSQPLPSPWIDEDIGQVGIAGSSTYSNGVFTVKGAGADVWSTADSFHFVYQTLSGDGAIIARVASVSPTSATPGIMIRDTLNTNAMSAFGAYSGSTAYLNYRTTTGGNTGQSSQSAGGLPYWLKVARNGGTLTAYTSSDGVNWITIGGSQTINMGLNVDVGMVVCSNSTSTLATATFDNVLVTGVVTPAITSISPTSGVIGTSVTVTGMNFGPTQGTSSVRFNGITATPTSWSNTQIVTPVPSGASTGPVTVVVGGNGSNADFTFIVYNPVISYLTPASAPAGASVTIVGTGFGPTQGNSTAQFNSVTASVTSWGDSSITVTVPSNATSGPVTVTADGVTSNGIQFNPLGYLSITSISSSSGPVGMSLTINGAGFGTTQGNSIAAFNFLPANITSWSNTQIVAVVPIGAGPGPVTVQVANVTALGPTFTPFVKTVVTDSLGNSSTYVAGVSGASWHVSSGQGSGCSTCTVRGVKNYAYDSYGNVSSLTDPNGNTATYTYDSANNVLSEMHPVDSTHHATTSYTYNSFGEALTVTDALGNVTTNTYDSHGNLTSVTTPAPNGNTAASVTQFAYNSLGELTTITDPLNHVATLTYTTAGLVSTITDAQNHVTTYGYDAHGNRTTVKDANNQTTTFTYDAGDRLNKITYPDNTTTTFVYDDRGRRTSVTDQNGKTTTYAYDDADRLTSVTNAANQATTYGHDTENNLTTLTDANTHSTFLTYDAFGRLTKTNFPSSQSETYAYDANNNLTSKTDRKGQTLTYMYDDLNRLTSKTYPDTTSVAYTYDLAGKVLQVTDPSGTYAFSYDNMGRPTGTTTSYSFLTGRNFSTSYSYDAASNRTGFTDPEGSTTGYTYDALNRLTALAPPAAFGSGSFGFSYDALSRPTQMTRPNNVTTNYTYDNLSRLLSVLHQVGSSTIDGASYGLDTAGNRTSKTDWLANVTSNYTYDQIYELTQVTQGNNTTESYTYDPVHNRLSSLGVTSYTNNNSNELTATSTTSYTYDNNGNMVSKTDSTGTTTYAWDFDNRLTSVTLPGSGGTVTFKYDPLGRRIYKSSSLGTTVFSYNGSRLAETVNSNGGVVARYIQGVGIDEPLAELQSGATSYYEADGLGSVTSLTSAAGAVANTYTYDSFGKQTASSGSVTNPFRYTGREFDMETNLSYNRARYFDPSTGRFLSEDPIRFTGGTNFYAYTRNNPANYADPLGLCPPSGGSNDNPCDYIGVADAPSQYAAAGLALQNSIIESLDGDNAFGLILAGLSTMASDFHQGGPLDPQPFTAGTPLQQATYGNYVYGVFSAAAGLSLDQALTAASIYGYKQQLVNGAYKGRTFGPDYRGIPAANVQDIISGYNDYVNGTLCVP
jgi:RHS repeat-associated protein